LQKFRKEGRNVDELKHSKTEDVVEIVIHGLAFLWEKRSVENSNLMASIDELSRRILSLEKSLRNDKSFGQEKDHSPQILRLPEVMALTSMSRTAIYEHMDKGTFPPSIKLGVRAMGWLKSDIIKWIENRKGK
jgi:predicted DNA-binding transcriptional regulator AlpA